MTQFATFLTILGIAGLFLLDYDRKERTSFALWLPIVWLGIAGSRPISAWLGISSTVDPFTDGSPFDRNVFSVLVVLGLLLVIARGGKVVSLLEANRTIVLFLIYCAVSVVWSDYFDIAFKRWIKSLGDFTMILIVLTENDRALALKRLLTRVGFVLVPFSVLLIKYYPDLGRYYSPYEGTAFYCGVAQDKNMLGKVCLVLGLGFCWRLYEELSGPRRMRVLVVLISILGMIAWLFHMADSMTSISCLIFGICVMLGASSRKIVRNRGLVHLMVMGTIILSFAVLFLHLSDFLLEALGRNPTLTGRTELWGELRAMPVDPIFGTGFESFWLGKRLQHIWALHWWHPTEAHDGYFEVLLNLGWLGLVLLAVAAIAAYRNILRLLDGDPSNGRIRLAAFVAAIAYNYTESAIRTLDPMWFLLLLTLFALPEVKPSSPPEEKQAEQPFWIEAALAETARSNV